MAGLLNKTPIAVDLDGTLTAADTLLISLLLTAVRRPWIYLKLISKVENKALFKKTLAEHTRLDPTRITYQPELLVYLKDLKNQGHPLYLVTGAHISIAKAISEHLGLFQDYYATDEANLTGSQKAKRLNQVFGEKVYVYAANAPIDLKVWQHSKAAIVVGSKPLRQKAAEFCPIQRFFKCGISQQIRAYQKYFWPARK